MRYVYSPRSERIKARIEAGLDVLCAVCVGLCGALFFFYFL